MDLEKANFKKAGEILAEVWSELVIDNHPVVATYVEDKEMEPSSPSEIWMSLHVLSSQYFLQIVKCDNINCCGPTRSCWKKVIPKRFLPPPAIIRKDVDGPSVPNPADVKSTDHFAGSWQRLAMASMFPVDGACDNFCPSLQKELPKRMCKHCKHFFTSAAAVQQHTRGEGCPSLVGVPIPRPDVLVLDEADEDVEDHAANAENYDISDDVMPVITIEDILNSPFIELTMGDKSGDENDA